MESLFRVCIVYCCRKFLKICWLTLHVVSKFLEELHEYCFWFCRRLKRFSKNSTNSFFSQKSHKTHKITSFVRQQICCLQCHWKIKPQYTCPSASHFHNSTFQSECSANINIEAKKKTPPPSTAMPSQHGNQPRSSPPPAPPFSYQ